MKRTFSSVNAAECHVGSSWWAPHPEYVWARVHVLSPPIGNRVQLQVVSDVSGAPLCSEDEMELPVSDLRSYEGIDFAKVENLCSLTKIDNAELLVCLRTRFEKHQIYTFAGATLISTNPFKKLDLYSFKIMEQYRHCSLSTAKPHIYALADVVYRSLHSDAKSQSLVISGDSGSGKTESAKFVLQYLTHVSSLRTPSPSHEKMDHTRTNSFAMRRTMSSSMPVPGDIEMKVMESNPLLEAFGNAQTLRNENSSRFGKYLQLFFEGDQMSGAKVQYFLLERARLVSHINGERCFHVFYWLCRGARPALLEKLGLNDEVYGSSSPPRFKYLCSHDSSTRLSPRRGVHSPAQSDSDDFQILVEAMTRLGIVEEQKEAVFCMLAAILHLGNIKFEEDNHNHAKIADDDESRISLSWAAKLLSVDDEHLRESLIARKLSKEKIHVPQRADEASFSRDALSKEIYTRLFRWIVTTINSSLQVSVHGSGSPTNKDNDIGILDIFGFEQFNTNGFEQLCINYSNEMLQNLFVSAVLRESEQALYAKEGIEWEAIEVPHAGLVLSLLEDSPFGILRLIDDECKLNTGSLSSLMHNMLKAHKDSPVFRFKAKPRRGQADTNSTKFTILHYAGEVEYQSDLFLVKNMDKCTDDAKELLSTSSDELAISILSCVQVEDTERMNSSTLRRSVRRDFIAGHFRHQLTQLITTLRATNTYFIRCIKPNHAMSPDIFHSNMVEEQLSNAGIMQLVHIRNAGYPVRMPREVFMRRYKTLGSDIVDILSSVDTHPTKRDYQLGTSIVFMRRLMHERLEVERLKNSEFAVVILQSYWRRFLAIRYANRRQSAIRLLQATLKSVLIQRQRRARESIFVSMMTYLASKRRRILYASVLTLQAAIRSRLFLKNAIDDIRRRETEAIQFQQRQKEEMEKAQREEMEKKRIEQEKQERVEQEKRERIEQEKRERIEQEKRERIEQEKMERVEQEKRERVEQEQRERIEQEQREKEKKEMKEMKKKERREQRKQEKALKKQQKLDAKEEKRETEARSMPKSTNEVLYVDRVDWPAMEGIEPMAVTNRLIVVVFTGQDIAMSMKRLIDNVLQVQYPNKFRIYNLCVEVLYELDPKSLMHLPFSGHSPCPFHLLNTFCSDISSWLMQNTDNIAILHSKAGKGRSSMMSCAHLMHQNLVSSATESMSYFWSSRSLNSDSSMTPSQRRYLHYYHAFINSPRDKHRMLNRTMLLASVNVLGFTYDSAPKDNELWLMIARGIDATKSKQKWIRMKERSENHCLWMVRSALPLQGDVKIEVLSRERKGKIAKVLLYCCFHIAFVDRKLVLKKKQIDKAFKDTSHMKFGENLTLEITFTDDETADKIGVPSIRVQTDDSKGASNSSQARTPKESSRVDSRGSGVPSRHQSRQGTPSGRTAPTASASTKSREHRRSSHGNTKLNRSAPLAPNCPLPAPPDRKKKSMPSKRISSVEPPNLHSTLPPPNDNNRATFKSRSALDGPKPKRLDSLSTKLKKRIFQWKGDLDPQVHESDFQESIGSNNSEGSIDLGSTVQTERPEKMIVQAPKSGRTFADAVTPPVQQENMPEKAKPQTVPYLETEIIEHRVSCPDIPSEPIKNRRSQIEKLFQNGHGFGVASPSDLHERRRSTTVSDLENTFKHAQLDRAVINRKGRPLRPRPLQL